MNAMKQKLFEFDAATFVKRGCEQEPGEWSDETRGSINKLRVFYPEISHWGDLAIGSAFGGFSRDFLEVSWAEWMLEKRTDLFLSYCCLIQMRGEWPFHYDEDELLQINEWRN